MKEWRQNKDEDENMVWKLLFITSVCCNVSSYTVSSTVNLSTPSLLLIFLCVWVGGRGGGGNVCVRECVCVCVGGEAKMIRWGVWTDQCRKMRCMDRCKRRLAWCGLRNRHQHRLDLTFINIYLRSNFYTQECLETKLKVYQCLANSCSFSSTGKTLPGVAALSDAWMFHSRNRSTTAISL